MTVSTCRDCTVRREIENIESMVRRALTHINGQNDLEQAYKLLSDAISVLSVVIVAQTEL